MPKFRKRPVVIDAILWTGGNLDEIAALDATGLRRGIYLTPACTLVINTLEGHHQALIGDWIIRGVAGELYPCKPEIFEKTYEPA